MGIETIQCVIDRAGGRHHAVVCRTGNHRGAGRRRYSAAEAMAMGLVNTVVPDDELDAEVDKWCAEICEKSPTAIAIAKSSFNASTDNIRGMSRLGFEAVNLYYETEESKEGGKAFREKRKPDFRSKQIG